MASHLISASAQVRSLAKAVSAAFAASALTAEERNPGRIDITDLPWLAPPLECTATLGGLPLSSYLNVPMALEQRALVRFWHKTLDDLWYRPSSAMRRGVFTNCGAAMPQVKLGQRAFLFSTPIGLPANLDMTAGAMLSLEVAQAALNSLPVHDVVSDDSNFYVVMPDSTQIGVRAGRPACSESLWSADVSGMVQEMRASSRGEVDYTCRYDQLAMVRSVAHTHRKRIVEFEGLDYALQALRLLSLGGHCPELLTEMHLAPLDVTLARRCEAVLRDAISIVDDLSMSDRSKLQIWHNTLVPEVITASRFRQHIYSGSQFPFSLSQAKLAAIRTWLEGQYRDLPPNLQREGVCKA